MAYDKIVNPMIDDFLRSLKRLDSPSFRVTTSKRSRTKHFAIKSYTEEDLETEVICDACELQFAIYGVFASCPDCSQINAYTIFRKSLEVSRKKLEFLLQYQEVTKEFLESSLKEILSDSVSSFDGLGKALQKKYPDINPKNIKNFFQKLDLLDGAIENVTGVKLSAKHSDFPFLLKMFQVRHSFIHNMGVIDDDYVRKMPQDAHLLGRKYPLKKEEITSFTQGMEEIVSIIEGLLTP